MRSAIGNSVPAAQMLKDTFALPGKSCTIGLKTVAIRAVTDAYPCHDPFARLHIQSDKRSIKTKMPQRAPGHSLGMFP